MSERQIRSVVPARRVLLALAVAPLAAGCTDFLDRLLSPDAPGIVQADDLEDPAYASLLVEGLIADFDCAFAHYTVAAGLVGSELMDPQANAGQWEFDRRSFNPSGGWYALSTCSQRLGAYAPVSTARWAADNALRKLEGWTDEEVPNRRQLIAMAAAYAGYSLILLGEGFCTAAVDVGPELTRSQVFELAEERFTHAIQAAEAAGDQSILNMALVGRARARLNLGLPNAAAEDARRVPDGFVHNASYSAASFRSVNRVFRMNNQDRHVSVYQAFWDLEFGGVADPRVSVIRTGVLGPNQRTPMAEQTKYASEDSPMPIARWAEAQLIIAEAEGGQIAVDIINELHRRAGLPELHSEDPGAILAQVIEERRRELFLESHHLGDLNRYDLPLDPPPGTEFVMGGVYGEQQCFPLPDVERDNNPNIP